MAKAVAQLEALTDDQKTKLAKQVETSKIAINAYTKLTAIDDASWWIDNREATPEELVRLHY